MFGRLVAKESYKSLALGLSLVLAGAFLVGLSSSNANVTTLNGTTPDIHNPQPTGGSWIDAPYAQRLYAEDFGSSYDDDSFFSIPSGVECRGKEGPMLVIGTGIDCTYASSTTTYRYDEGRTGAIEVGFEINFFGDTFDSLFPSENGAVFFSEPNTRYNKNILELSGDSESSGMYPLAMDLYFNKIESNFWVANTTVGQNQAFVMSWENLDPCCDDVATPGVSTSFQLVLIDLGDGDFDAYFNYDTFLGMSVQGYDAPQFAIDLSTTSAGDTSVRLDTIEGFPADACVSMELEETVGQETDEVFEDLLGDDFYARLADPGTKSLALYTDDSCSTAIVVEQAQSIDVDRHAYHLIILAEDTFNSTAIGWGTYSATDGKIEATELRKNLDNSLLEDGKVGAINMATYRTTVPGRFVIGQRGGGTVGDPASDDEEAQSSGWSTTGPTYKPMQPRPIYTNAGGLTVSNADGNFMPHSQISTSDEHYLYGEDWNFRARSTVGSSNEALSLAKDGSLKGRTNGSVVLRGSGYAPKTKVSIFAMPGGTLLGTVRATKVGKMNLSRISIPKNVSLSNTHIQVIGKSSSDEVRFITLSVRFTDGNTLAGDYSRNLSVAQKAELRKMATLARGEKTVTCLARVTSSESANSSAALAAGEACQYLAVEYPRLKTRVRQDSSNELLDPKVRVIFSR